PEASSGIDSHVRDGFLLRELAVFGGAPRKIRWWIGRQESLLLQFGNGSGRRRDQARALRDEARQDDRVLRVLSRSHDGVALIDGVEVHATQEFRCSARWRRAHSLSLCLSLRVRAWPGNLRRRNSGATGKSDFQAALRSFRSCGNYH